MTEFRAAHNAAFSPRLHMPAQPETPVAPLFAVGDTVMHASEGICTVLEILKPEMEKSSSTVYMPVSRGNEVLRRLLTRSDIDALIAQSRLLPSLWIEDAKQRRDAFHAVLSSCDYARMMRMIAEIYEHNTLRLAEGKKPCAADENIREEAEKLLHQEFSHVLGLSSEETVAYIQSGLNATS